jgi:hypothetical protein
MKNFSTPWDMAAQVVSDIQKYAHNYSSLSVISREDIKEFIGWVRGWEDGMGDCYTPECHRQRVDIILRELQRRFCKDIANGNS